MKYFLNSDSKIIDQLSLLNPEDELSDQESFGSDEGDLWDRMFDEEIERQRKISRTFEGKSINQQKKNSNSDKKQPKRKRTAYLFYTSSMRSKVSIQHQGLPPAEITRILANNWKNLTDEERAPFIERAKEDQNRWENEKLDFMSVGKDESIADDLDQLSKDSSKKRGRKKRERKWTKDPEAPKKALSPYIIYGQKARPEIIRKLKETNDYNGSNVMKHISYQWKSMTQEEKDQFKDFAKNDKERYEKEKYEYEQKKIKVPSNQAKISFITENVDSHAELSVSNENTLLAAENLIGYKESLQPRFHPDYHQLPPTLINGHLKPIFDANLLHPFMNNYNNGNTK